MKASALFDEMAHMNISGTSIPLQHFWKFRSLQVLTGFLQRFVEHYQCFKFRIFLSSLMEMSASVDWICCAVSDCKLQRRSPRTQTAAEVKLKVETMSPLEGTSIRKGDRCTDSLIFQTAEGVGEQTLTTQQQRSASEGVILNCMVSFKSMERARSTLEDFHFQQPRIYDTCLDQPLCFSCDNGLAGGSADRILCSMTWTWRIPFTSFVSSHCLYLLSLIYISWMRRMKINCVHQH